MGIIKRKLSAVFAAVRALSGFFWLITQSDDPYRFIYYCKQGSVERAFDTLKISEDEIHSTISDIRSDAELIADEMPESIKTVIVVK